MKKLAVGLLAAVGIALAIPAHAQGIWFGAGPVSVVFGTGYGYGYGPSWGGSYPYAPGYAYGYSYAPEYTYAPAYAYGSDYDVSYGYGPGYGYSYAPDYVTTTYPQTTFAYSSSAYPRSSRYSRSVVRMRSSQRFASRPVSYRSARVSAIGYQAQASVQRHHAVEHTRHLRLDR